MAREEQIIEAGIEYTMRNNPCCIGGDNFYEQVKQFNRNKSFEAGAEWADEHSKSPWISVNDDLPCNHKELMYESWLTCQVFVRLISKNGCIFYAANCMTNIQLNKKWIWAAGEEYKVTHWMPIPELPKE